MTIPVKIMSFNIRHGADAEGTYAPEKAAEVIRRSGAELIGLQEVDRHYSSRSHYDDTIGRLASMLGMHFAYGANLDRAPARPGLPRSQYGNAVLSKYPIVKEFNHLLPSFGQEQRGLLEALIDLRGNHVYFYSTHLGLSEDQRFAQTDEILSIAGRTSGAQLIVGDFNAKPDSPVIKKMAALYQEPFADQPDAYTIDSRKPYAKIDYIWANDEWLPGEAAYAEVIQVQVSDHFPIVCRLHLKQAEEQLADRTLIR